MRQTRREEEGFEMERQSSLEAMQRRHAVAVVVSMMKHPNLDEMDEKIAVP
jgi:hypothetical protein